LPFRILSVLLILFGFALASARAQVPGQAAGDLDGAKQTIDQIEARLARGGLTDGVLQQLRDQIDPVTARMNAVASDLVPRMAAVRDRLAQLGPAPDPKSNATEASAITADRSAQQKLFDDLDGTAKRAKVLAVQAAQISDTIVTRRRDLFAHDLFARSRSLGSPGLWTAVAVEVPADAQRVATLARNWGQAASDRLSVWQKPVLALLLAALALGYYPVWRVAVRVRSRDPEARPTRFGKAVAAVRVAATTAIVPVAAVLALGGLVVLFDLPNLLQALGESLTVGVVVVALGTGLSRGLFAPKSPNWRLPPIGDDTAKNLYHLTITVTAIVAAEHVVEAVNAFIQVGVPTAIATRGLGALAVAVAIGLALRRAWLRRHGAETPALGDPQGEHWAALLRVTGRAVAVLLLVAVLVGYVALAAFLVEQVIAIAGTLAMLYVLLILADEGFRTALRPQSAIGRGLAALVGLRPDGLAQIAVLSSAVVRVSLLVAAALLVLAPWRIESGDMLATVEAAFFGFAIGGATISIASLIVTRSRASAARPGWRRPRGRRAAPPTGLQNSIKTSLGYVGFIAALGLSLAYLGLSFERLTLIVGGLSLGIGLGLQSVTNNFVSGLIMLWERAVRVGDWVEVGAEQGFVRRINVRSTEIETFDRALVIMPNASLVSGVVKNWVRNDRVGRIKLPFVVPLSADPEAVRTALIATARAHERVLTIPTPSVFFTGLGEANMTFDLVCFIDDVESRIRVTSDLLYDIHAKLKAAGYVNPPAAPTVSSPALDRLDAWLNEKLAEDKGRAAAAE